jgi:hypothetical protein
VHRGCVDAASTTFKNVTARKIDAKKHIDVLDWIIIFTMSFNLKNLESMKAIFNANVEENVFFISQEIEMFQFSWPLS